MTFRAIAPVLLLALSASACATRPVSDVSAFARESDSNSFEPFDGSVQSSALVLPVEHDRQVEGAACGAHVLASVVNYWRGERAVSGAKLFTLQPPADGAHGYSMAELMAMAQAQGLTSSAVRLNLPDLIHELDAGRPVLVPVRLPSIYVQNRSLPETDTRALDVVRGAVMDRVGRVSEFTDLALVDHYLLLVGYDRDRFVVVEPVMGFRTISFERIERYRRQFDDAAMVFSGPSPPPAAAPRRRT